jgi:hypothetical protein
MRHADMRRFSARLAALLQAKRWPLADRALRADVASAVCEIQQDIRGSAAASSGDVDDNTKMLMQTCIASLPVRLYAIDCVARSPGRKLAGVDFGLLTTQSMAILLANRLSLDFLQN